MFCICSSIEYWVIWAIESVGSLPSPSGSMFFIWPTSSFRKSSFPSELFAVRVTWFADPVRASVPVVPVTPSVVAISFRAFLDALGQHVHEHAIRQLEGRDRR